MTQPHNLQRSGDTASRDTGPVFSDPSGQRRRVLRVLGGAASIVLAGALIMAGIGLFGGPDTPLSVFGATSTHGRDHSDSARAGKQSAGRAGGGAAGGTAPASGGRHSSLAPSPSHSGTRARPSPTNRAGKTPRGRSRSRRPHPSPSPHGS